MRIVVNDIAASSGGAMSVLRDFYAYVCENDHENEWIFLLNDRYFEETNNVKIITMPEVKRSKVKKLLFDFVTGRKYINNLAPDVVFSMQNIITFGLKVPQVVYIHQPLPFQRVKKFSLWKKNERSLAIVQSLIGYIIKLSAKKSSCVIVQTQWMKTAVCSMCSLPDNKVFTSLPHVKPMNELCSELKFVPTTFFYPTADILYKNNDCLRKASQILYEKGYEHKVTLTIGGKDNNPCIEYTGRLPYEEVMRRYQCSSLVFPSYIETFGYPLAEARRMGTIVIASDTPFSREVLEGYGNAYYFDPFKPEELANLMEQVISGKITRISTTCDNPSLAIGWKLVVHLVLNVVR